MIKKLSAIGLSHLDNSTKGKSKLIKHAQENADKVITIENKSNIHHEHYCYLSERFGVVTYSSESEKDQLKTTSWEVFGISETLINVVDLTFDRTKKGLLAYAQELESGNEFEFKVINIIDFQNYVKSKKNKKRNINSYEEVFKVNLIGLSSSGTILFPVFKNPEALEFRNLEEETHKELIQKASSGDENALIDLFESTLATSKKLGERLKDEDVFSVFESYFIPDDISNGVFRILGEITSVTQHKNKMTNEEVLELIVNTSNTMLNIFINKNNLVGLPIIGMRFSGFCSLQGIVEFK